MLARFWIGSDGCREDVMLSPARFERGVFGGMCGEHPNVLKSPQKFEEVFVTRLCARVSSDDVVSCWL